MSELCLRLFSIYPYHNFPCHPLLQVPAPTCRNPPDPLINLFLKKKSRPFRNINHEHSIKRYNKTGPKNKLKKIISVWAREFRRRKGVPRVRVKSPTKTFTSTVKSPTKTPTLANTTYLKGFYCRPI